MAQQWYCRIGGKKYGPLSAQQLKQLAASGKLKPEDGVRRESDEKWAPAGKVKGLFATGGAKSASAAAKPKAAAKPIETAAAKPAAKSKPEPSAPKPAKKPTPVAKPLPDEPDDDDELMLAPPEPSAKQPGPVGNLSAPVAIPGRPATAYEPPGYGGPAANSELAMDGLNYFRVLATGVTGVAISFATVCLAQLPILPLLAGVVGALFALRTFSLSKGDRNAIGLAFVAMMLSMVGFFWGLRSTMADPQPVTTLQEVFGIIKPNPGQGTLQGTQDIGELGGLAVSVSEAYVGTVPGVPESHYYFVVQIRIKNESTDTINYTSWNTPESGAILQDASGKQYKIVSSDRISGQLGSQALAPGKQVKDVLVFENPKGFNHSSLRLTLSGRGIGTSGKVVFNVPHSIENFRRSPLSSGKKKSTTVEVGGE